MKRKFIRVAIDVILLVVVGVLTVIFLISKPSIKQGFHCDDESLRYPVPSHMTVSSEVLLLFSFITPIILIIVGEALHAWPFNKQSTTQHVKNALRQVVFFLFAMCATMILTAIAKTTVGRLRPFFFDFCKPYWGDTPCTAGLYISDYNCTETKYDDLSHMAYASFFSGHASLSAASAFYAIIYIQYNWDILFSVLLRPLVQIALVCVTVFISASRVRDHVHHWSDVYVGFLVGAAMGTWLAVLFVRPVKPATQDEDIPLLGTSTAND